MNLKKAARGAASDLAIASLIVLGVVGGYQWASSVALFAIWFFGIAGILVGASWDDVAKKMSTETRERNKAHLRSRVWRTYDVATDTGFVVALAAIGWFWTASLLAVSCILFKGSMYQWAEKEAT